MLKYSLVNVKIHIAQKMKFSITDFLSKCNQIRRKLQIWSHLMKKSEMKILIFCAVLKRTMTLQNFQKLVSNSK